MAEINTDSYPKAALPVSPLEMAGKLGSLQQQQQQIQSGAISIDKQKLDLMNTQFGLMNQELSTMIDDPSITKPQAAERLNRFAKTLKLPPEAVNHMMEELNAAPSVKAFSENALRRGMDTQQRINQQYGVPETQQDNSTIYQGVRAPAAKGGGFVPATKMAVQPPPTQGNVDTRQTLPNGQPNPNYGQPGIIGASAPSGVLPATPSLPVASPAGAAPAPQPRLRGLPVEPLPKPAVSGPTGPTKQTGFDFNQRFAGEPIATGLAPGVSGAIETVGKKSGEDYATDLTRAKSFQSDIYPMHRVLDIVKEEGPKAFGPGTEGLNTVKSALVTWLPNVDQKTIDGVSNFEQAKKYLVQAARTAGNTGTNDQLAAAFEANPNVKMSGATIENVVKSNIALRRMQQAQTLLFGQQNLPPSEYSKWISQNQNSLDPRAFGFDMMSPEAKKKLIDDLSKDKKAYQKFETSLQFAHDADLIEKPGRK